MGCNGLIWHYLWAAPDQAESLVLQPPQIQGIQQLETVWKKINWDEDLFSNHPKKLEKQNHVWNSLKVLISIIDLDIKVFLNKYLNHIFFFHHTLTEIVFCF